MNTLRPWKIDNFAFSHNVNFTQLVHSPDSSAQLMKYKFTWNRLQWFSNFRLSRCEIWIKSILKISIVSSRWRCNHCTFLHIHFCILTAFQLKFVRQSIAHNNQSIRKRQKKLSANRKWQKSRKDGERAIDRPIRQQFCHNETERMCWFQRSVTFWRRLPTIFLSNCRVGAHWLLVSFFQFFFFFSCSRSCLWINLFQSLHQTLYLFEPNRT